MHPRAWTVAAWTLIAVAVAFVYLACVWDWVPDVSSVCSKGACVPPAPAYVGGLVFVVLAALALSGAVGCFFWAAHRRVLDNLRALLDSRS